MKLIEVIEHDDNTYQFVVNGVTWYNGVTAEKAMSKLSYIVRQCNNRAEDYEIVFK